MWHSRKLILFVLLSVADFSLTWLLLQGSPSHIYESNPVASWILRHWGWGGLALFKTGIVCVVGGLAVFISRRKQKLGGLVLRFGCAVLAVVVVYSGALAAGFRGLGLRESGLEAQVERNEREAADLTHRAAQAQDYFRLKQKLSRELISGDCSLEDAVGRLQGADYFRDARFVRGLCFAYPGRPAAECLAASLVDDVTLELGDRRSIAEEVLPGLLEQYRNLFDHEPPWTLDYLLRRGQGIVFQKRFGVNAPIVMARAGKM